MWTNANGATSSSTTSAARGLRRRFRPLTASPQVVNTNSSPSSMNHTGITCGCPLGALVASLAVRVPWLRNARISSGVIWRGILVEIRRGRRARTGGRKPACCHRSGGLRHPRRHLGEVDHRLRDAVEVVGEHVERDVRDDRRDVGVVVAGGAEFGEVAIAHAATCRIYSQRESEGGGDPLVVRLARAVVV